MSINKRIVSIIKFCLNELLPPIIRDSRYFYICVIKTFNRAVDPDFKIKVINMTKNEYKEAYEKMAESEYTKISKKDMDFVIENISGSSILEIGCGKGDISKLCSLSCSNVYATDISIQNLRNLKLSDKNEDRPIMMTGLDIEFLPFKDKSVDTLVCLYTLEHIVNVYEAVKELKRVTKKRIIVIVPRERYFRYTANYHVNFFGGKEQLALLIGLSKYKTFSTFNKIYYLADV